MTCRSACCAASSTRRSLVMAMTSAAGFTPNVRWRLRNVETVRSVVGRGLGYTMIMGRPSGDRTYDGHALVYKRIADELPDNSVQLVLQAGSLGNAKVRAGTGTRSVRGRSSLRNYLVTCTTTALSVDWTVPGLSIPVTVQLLSRMTVLPVSEL